MCGLVGIAGKLEHSDESLMKRLLIFDYLRGTDSTGMAFLRSGTNTPKAGLVKMARNPLDLFDTGSFNKALNGYQSTVFLGHNRAATVGKVTNVNAHPFQVNDTFGAHNGTLYDQCWKALDKATGIDTDVDSLALYTAIDMFGPEAAIGMVEEGASSVKGAWALTWFNEKEEKLYFLKNQHRPLWYAFTEDLTKIVWASECWMIEAAFASGKTEIKPWLDDEGYGYFSVENDKLYEIDIEELKTVGKKKPPKMITKDIKGKEPPKVVYNNTGTGAPFHHTGAGKTTKNGGGTSSASNNNVLSFSLTELFGDSQEPFAGFIDKADFDEIAKYGCSWCSADIEYGELGVAIYERTDTILCPGCSGVKEDTIKIYADPISFEAVEDRVKRCKAK